MPLDRVVPVLDVPRLKGVAVLHHRHIMYPPRAGSCNALDDASIPAVRWSLRDGRTFRVVKVFWEERKLQSQLDDLGWSIEVESIILRS
jgi:hypothetical protein